MMGREYIIYFICFVIELLKYIYGAKILLNTKLKRYYYIAIPMILYFPAIIFFSTRMKMWFMYIFVYVTIFFMMNTTIKRRLTIFFLMFAYIGCLDEIFSGVLLIVSPLSGNILTLISSLFCLISLILMGLIKKRISSKEIRLYKFIQKRMYILISILAISALLADSFLNIISYEIKDNYLKELSEIISIFSTISLLMIIIFFIYILKINEWMELSIEKERHLKRAQTKYYETLLAKEEGTRKFRHDILNHYICIQGYLRTHEYDKADGYLQVLLNEIKNVHERLYSCGNLVIDSLLNYYVNKLDQNVRIQVNANCGKKVSLSDTDLCIIVGNLLQNAVESLLREDNMTPILKVEIEQKEVNLFITIQNSVPAGYEFDIEKYTTKKVDKINHGIGIKNIMECLKRYDGGLEQYCREGFFVSKVYIKYL